MVIVAYLSAVTVLYTVAVMLHAGVIDALVIGAAPDTLRGRYVAAFNLSWAAANALGSVCSLLARLVRRAAVDHAGGPIGACPGGCTARRAGACQRSCAYQAQPRERDAAIAKWAALAYFRAIVW